MLNKYLGLLNVRRADYKTWAPAYCRAIDAYVYFNMQGFNHLRLKINGASREIGESTYKINLLSLVRAVVHTAAAVKEYRRQDSPIKSSRKKYIKEIEYWAIEAKIGRRNMRVRVILRKVHGDNRISFWSAMKAK
jgi:hypothetical protein